MYPPKICESNEEQREQFIRERFMCISNCENCGICKVLRGKTPEVAFADYIKGKREFIEVQQDYR